MESPVAPENFRCHSEFKVFFRQEWPRLVSYCRVVFNLPLPAAEDVAQEAFLSVFRHWEIVDRPGGYIRKVATRSALKRRPEEPVADMTALLAEGVSGDAEPEERYLVQEALRQLPGQQRAVFALHLDDYADHDIAGILGLSTATVRSYRRHARQALARWHRHLVGAGPSTEGQPR
jgi:RNA polymerase sigma factor (sigma-70 family)